MELLVLLQDLNVMCKDFVCVDLALISCPTGTVYDI